MTLPATEPLPATETVPTTDQPESLLSEDGLKLS